MLSVCRRTAALNVLSVRCVGQRRWMSLDNNNNNNSNSSSNVTGEQQQQDEAAATSSQFEGLLNVLDERKKPLSPVEGITKILLDGTKPNEPKNDAYYDVSYLSSSLSSLTLAPYQLHINATFNNTIITLTRPNGAPLVTTSGGTAGFKKAQRSGYEAAHQAAVQLLEKMQTKNLQVPNIHIVLKGLGPGRDAAFKALVAGAAWNVRRITDATPMPFGGCRPKKARRL